ncbi:hypothetical protein B0H17DRAFT_1280285 [Mycena rosella]|uniref:Uncharacterized protein n=1 Tax=Mycena rosella TaxID=1033263 RepID=A0AAD7DJE4_MYCRO|nr:hypothetical protein B0H17DRAFT_1280285 [Mycena rosella]
MFSKILVFGFAALALVGAVPSPQVPIVSCSISDPTRTAPSFSSKKPDEPIFTVRKYTPPGPLGQWKKVEEAGPDTYRIANANLITPTFVNSEDPMGKSFPGQLMKPMNSSSWPRRDTFVIGLPNGEGVWTIDKAPKISPVTFSPFIVTGSATQQWSLWPVEFERYPEVVEL